MHRRTNRPYDYLWATRTGHERPDPPSTSGTVRRPHIAGGFRGHCSTSASLSGGATHRPERLPSLIPIPQAIPLSIRHPLHETPPSRRLSSKVPQRSPETKADMGVACCRKWALVCRASETGAVHEEIPSCHRRPISAHRRCAGYGLNRSLRTTPSRGFRAEPVARFMFARIVASTSSSG